MTQTLSMAAVTRSGRNSWPRKQSGIGGTLEDLDEPGETTTITDIYFQPNGTDSAAFGVEGADYGCGGDVRFLAVDPATGGNGWIGFIGYGGHRWRIKKKGQ